MRVGLALPVVSAASAGTDAWERAGDLDDISLVAEAADRFGYHHLAWPPDAGARSGWDPAVTLGYLAARTEKIALVAPVLPAALSVDDLARYETLHRTLGERLISASADGGRFAHGFTGTPLWMVDEGVESARWALLSADGWQSHVMPSQPVIDVFQTTAWPIDFQMVVGCGRLDPIGESAAALHALRAGWAVGATLSTVALSAVSADHFCEQMAALRELLVEDGEV